MLATGVCRVGSRASEEAVGLGKEDGTKVGRSGQQAVVSGAWKTGSFNPVGDGFEGGELFYGQKASAFFWRKYYLLLLLLRDEVCGTSGGEWSRRRIKNRHKIGTRLAKISTMHVFAPTSSTPTS